MIKCLIGIFVFSTIIAATAAPGDGASVEVQLWDVPEAALVLVNGQPVESRANPVRIVSARWKIDRVGVLVTAAVPKVNADNQAVWDIYGLVSVVRPGERIVKRFDQLKLLTSSNFFSRANGSAYLDISGIAETAPVTLKTIGSAENRSGLQLHESSAQLRRYAVTAIPPHKRWGAWLRIARSENTPRTLVGAIPLQAGDWFVLGPEQLLPLDAKDESVPFPTFDTVALEASEPSVEAPVETVPSERTERVKPLTKTTFGYLKLKVMRDTKVTINDKFTEQEGEIRLFSIPLKAGETFSANVKLDYRHPVSGRQIIRKKTYVLRPGETEVEDDVEAIPEILKP